MTRVLPCAVLSIVALSACAPAGRSVPGAAAPSATAAVTASSLRERLTAFAHDTMHGRQAGVASNYRATEWLAAEAARIGLEPAGENGSYFQTIPLMEVSADTTVTLAVAGQTYRFGTDFMPITPVPGQLPFGIRSSPAQLQVVYGGSISDTVRPPRSAYEGKLVVLGPPRPGTGVDLPGAFGSVPGAAAIAVTLLDFVPPQNRHFLYDTRSMLAGTAQELAQAPLVLLVSNAVGEALLGGPMASAAAGSAGRETSFGAMMRSAPAPAAARNVIALARGRSPTLRGQMVAVGAHSDHDGFAARAHDHDSIYAFNRVARRGGQETALRAPTAEEAARIKALRDSLAAVRAPRLDSIYNGADDDGSGSVALLELAEALVAQPADRSVLFVWHTAEELGLLGSRHFTANPTVARDSIVAMINIDMIGRGGAQDTEGGGPGYLELVGSRRLSRELGDLVEAVNTEGNFGMRFSYELDADAHPLNIYCRSDHANYARFGIPVAFLSTGGHPDYHQLTDEVQYIDFAQLERVSRFTLAVVYRVANLDHRLALSAPKPDPEAPCQQ